MAALSAETLTIAVGDTHQVSALLQIPARATACFVLAHGAGAGMRHAFLEAAATGLAERGIGTLRYQFPYMESGSKRPDPPALCHATVRAAVAEAARHAPALPLIAGGKSFGGRMTSQAQAVAPLPGVVGLAFIGFPLHPPKRPSDERAEHLSKVRVPLLFLQGTRDEFAEPQLLEPLIARLADRATLKPFPDADHSFHVRARSGRTDAQTFNELLDELAGWIKTLSP